MFGVALFVCLLAACFVFGRVGGGGGGVFVCSLNRLVGLVVKASDSRAADPCFHSRLNRDFSASSYTSDLKICTPVAAVPDA